MSCHFSDMKHGYYLQLSLIDLTFLISQSQVVHFCNGITSFFKWIGVSIMTFLIRNWKVNPNSIFQYLYLIYFRPEGLYIVSCPWKLTPTTRIWVTTVTVTTQHCIPRLTWPTSRPPQKRSFGVIPNLNFPHFSRFYLRQGSSTIAWTFELSLIT